MAAFERPFLIVLSTSGLRLCSCVFVASLLVSIGHKDAKVCAFLFPPLGGDKRAHAIARGQGRRQERMEQERSIKNWPAIG